MQSYNTVNKQSSVPVKVPLKTVLVWFVFLDIKCVFLGYFDRCLVQKIWALLWHCSVVENFSIWMHLVLFNWLSDASISVGATLETGCNLFFSTSFFNRGQSCPVLVEQANSQQFGWHNKSSGGAAEGSHITSLLREVFWGAATVSACRFKAARRGARAFSVLSC